MKAQESQVWVLSATKQQGRQALVSLLTQMWAEHLGWLPVQHPRPRDLGNNSGQPSHLGMGKLRPRDGWLGRASCSAPSRLCIHTHMTLTAGGGRWGFVPCLRGGIRDSEWPDPGGHFRPVFESVCWSPSASCLLLVALGGAEECTELPEGSQGGFMCRVSLARGRKSGIQAQICHQLPV